ncbi:hypothetical protein BH09PAT2_BH09PAT2_11010 [soil metagenome]
MNATEQSIRHEQWLTRVVEQERSGLSQTEFCKQNNLVISQFTYYRGLIKASERDTLPKSNVFTPVKIHKPEQKSSSEIRILLPNGFQCFIPSHLEASHIKNLIAALLSC